MSYSLTVSVDGSREISCSIDIVFGRTLALLGLLLPQHLSERPQDTAIAMGCVLRTIEFALQSSPSSHSKWMALQLSQMVEPVVVDLVSLDEVVKTSLDESGGVGGTGGWPAGGGGGGGSGPRGSSGGAGADGALMIMMYDANDQLVDIDCFVLQGESNWVCPAGVASVLVSAFGGGGGGGGVRGWRI